MNMFRSNGGFTLVELIVVIAILAILAGITVPAYSSYMEKAEAAQEMVDAHAETMANEANEYLEQAAEYYDFGTIDAGVGE